MWGSSTQTHFRPNVGGKKPFKTKKKKIVTRRAPLGLFRWAPFFSVLPTDKIFPAYCADTRFIPFVIVYLCDRVLAELDVP